MKDCLLSAKAVYNCFAEFSRGRVSFSDEFREGRPKSVVIPNSINAKINCRWILQNLTEAQKEARAN